MLNMRSFPPPRGDADAAVQALQDALDLSGDDLALPLYDALGIVAKLLAAEGKIIAARGHFPHAGGRGRGRRPGSDLSAVWRSINLRTFHSC